MSKAYYLAAIANFCPIENPSEEEVTQYIKKVKYTDITISEQDVVLWAPDVETEVQLELTSEMSFDRIGKRLDWGFETIDNVRDGRYGLGCS